MNNIDFVHIPVLHDECIKNLNIKEDGIYIDCTLGGGGHSKLILEKLNGGNLIAFDKDMDAIDYSKKYLEKYIDKVRFIHDDFKNAIKYLDSMNIDKIDGYIIDLGVSSYQIDNPHRGFSYINDSPLDMRMNKDQNFSAKDIIQTYDEKRLADLIYRYGEERFSREIARNICKQRGLKDINSTLELSKVIEEAIPIKFRYKYGNCAKRTFQALRIEVNNELNGLKEAIESLTRRLKKGGRGLVISFHSLEDRIAKQTFNEMEKDCICPPDQPICNCNKIKEIKIINKKPITASSKELENNKRSSSAKLRVVEKI